MARAYRIVSIEVSIEAGTQHEVDMDARAVAEQLRQFLAWKDETKNRPFSVSIETRDIVADSAGK